MIVGLVMAVSHFASLGRRVLRPPEMLLPDGTVLADSGVSRRIAGPDGQNQRLIGSGIRRKEEQASQASAGGCDSGPQGASYFQLLLLHPAQNAR